MKYLILLGDGMADYPLDELSGRTPLEVAHTPNMDFIAASGTIGLLQSIPLGMPPGSDIAALSILGYDPRECYSGRGPFEAISMGVNLGADDIAFRCNLVTLSSSAPEIMDDFTAGHITSSEAVEIIQSLNQHLGKGGFAFYGGVGYRNLCVRRGGLPSVNTTPPHDLTGREVSPYLPSGEGGEAVLQMMRQAREVLKGHSVNRARSLAGKKVVSSIWPWGQGRGPQLEPLTVKYSISGSVISAVDLLNGIGACAGLQVVRVKGATGYTDTNYEGKALAALEALQQGDDFVLVHVEAPDEMGHEGNLKGKIGAIEDFDRFVVGTVLKGMGSVGDYRIMVLSDHFTPITLRTHTSDPTVFAVISSTGEKSRGSEIRFSERCAHDAGLLVAPGHLLWERFINGRI